MYNDRNSKCSFFILLKSSNYSRNTAGTSSIEVFGVQKGMHAPQNLDHVIIVAVTRAISYQDHGRKKTTDNCKSFNCRSGGG